MFPGVTVAIDRVLALPLRDFGFVAVARRVVAAAVAEPAIGDGLDEGRTITGAGAPAGFAVAVPLRKTATCGRAEDENADHAPAERVKVPLG